MYLSILVTAFIMLSFVVVWVIGLAMKDSSIVDIWFAPCLGIAAVIGWQLGGGADDRRTLVMVLALLWSLRLGGYLLWRNWGKEDRRYARLRQHVESQGKSYALHSLIFVNLYQGLDHARGARRARLARRGPGAVRHRLRGRRRPAAHAL